MTGPRIFFYVQHLLGIGHLARASRIAAALVEAGAEVTMVTGGLPVAGFPGPGVAHVALPPVQSADHGFSGLADAAGRPVDQAFLDARRDALLAAFHAVDPHAVITEAFPFGRRQMRFELLPLLEAARGRLLFCSLRDILQEKTKPGRDAETVAILRDHDIRVLVHGDPGFARLADSFPLADQIADRVTHTGLVAPPPPIPAGDAFDIVVSAGGGAVGGALNRAAAGALADLPGLRMLLLTGPNLPEAERRAIPPLPNLTVEAFRPDLAGLLVAARVSVSQAGYNTVCDVLQAGCRAVLVPFAAGGETEQTARATRLAARGRAVVVAEADLSAPRLAAAIRDSLAAPLAAGPPPALDGAARTARLIMELAATARVRAG